jgi:hypothetical protein
MARSFEQLTPEEQELVRIFERHHSELLPLEPEFIEQWLNHVKECGG